MANSSVGEPLPKSSDTSISAVSQHLRNMKDKSVVVNRKEGQTVYYRLKNPKMIKAAISCAKSCSKKWNRRGASPATTTKKPH